MESIEVRYKPLGTHPIDGGTYYHKYLVYTDSSGREWGAGGYPSENPLGGDAVGLITAELPGAGTWWSPFGTITTEIGAYVPPNPDIPSPGFPDYAPPGAHPSETIKTGDDLLGDWLRVLKLLVRLGQKVTLIVQTVKTQIRQLMKRLGEQAYLYLL